MHMRLQSCHNLARWLLGLYVVNPTRKSYKICTSLYVQFLEIIYACGCHCIYCISVNCEIFLILGNSKKKFLDFFPIYQCVGLCSHFGSHYCCTRCGHGCTRHSPVSPHLLISPLSFPSTTQGILEAGRYIHIIFFFNLKNIKRTPVSVVMFRCL